MKTIDPTDLIPMDHFLADHPIEIDVMYAGKMSFCGPVYRPDARLQLHRDMAEIVLVTAHLVRKRGNATLILHDGLRTTTVQALICDTPIVKAHPHWTAEGPLRMFAPPGKGGHPRGMAIDVSLRGADGALLDMGTLVDALPEGGADKNHNPAHREYVNLSNDVRRNRDLLTSAFLDVAACFHRPLRPLPSLGLKAIQVLKVIWFDMVQSYNANITTGDFIQRSFDMAVDYDENWGLYFSLFCHRPDALGEQTQLDMTCACIVECQTI